MKTILTLIVTAVFVIYPSICFSSYIIHLKDGRKFPTEQYYEEGDQIKFKRYGGVIGIQKGLVREIEEIEEVEELPEQEEPTTKAETDKQEASEAAKKPEVKKEGGAEEERKVKVGEQEVPDKIAKEQGAEQAKEQEKPEQVSEEEKKKAEQEKTAKMQAFLEEKRQIMREMEIVTLALKDTKAKNNKAERRKWLMERAKLLNRLSDLQESVKETHGGKLPDWWQNDL